MKEEEFANQIEVVRDRASLVYNEAQRGHFQASDLLPVAVEELRTALEELQVAEEELRHQNQELLTTRHQVDVERQRYQDLFEFAPDCYLLTNSQGVITEANRAAAKLFNLPQKYLLNKPLITFVVEQERQDFVNELLRLQQKERVQEWELVMQARNGLSFDAAITVAGMYNPDGGLVGMRWLVRDITARKQAEAQRRRMEMQNLQLLEESRLKSQFLAVMSHELRTPLNAILGFSQVMLRQFDRQLLPQHINMIERILNNGKQLLTVINDILDFSRLQAGRLEFKLEVFNIDQLVTTIVNDFRRAAEQKNLSLQLNITLKNPQVVNDSDRLRQIIVNLLSNAIKFTESGSVWVEVRDFDGDKLEIIVKDTGVGINDIELQNIFKEFRQVNQSHTRTQGGTGLGLAITNSLVHLMNGKITVKSQLGEGSTFRVELPHSLSLQQSSKVVRTLC
ncbi:MAG TPA: ATP-binding protein [Candidatus Sericytochromatia bacterium]